MSKKENIPSFQKLSQMFLLLNGSMYSLSTPGKRSLTAFDTGTHLRSFCDNSLIRAAISRLGNSKARLAAKGKTKAGSELGQAGNRGQII